MTNEQENKLGMYRAVGTVLTNHAAEYASVAALGTQATNLQNSISLIGELIRAQTKDATGVTVDKAILQTQMVDMTFRVAGALKAYGSDTNNNALQNQADLNKSTFTRARDDERDDISQRIHDVASENVAALAPYGITAATLSALQTRIDAYVAAIDSRGPSASRRPPPPKCSKRSSRAPT
jgi:signal transduction histidine kinase